MSAEYNGRGEEVDMGLENGYDRIIQQLQTGMWRNK